MSNCHILMIIYNIILLLVIKQLCVFENIVLAKINEDKLKPSAI